jgi:hypothetical protein
MRRIIFPVTAIAVLPLVLAACGSTSTTSTKTSSQTGAAHLSPQAAVNAAYHAAGASPASFHVDETVGIAVNGKNYGGSTISGNVYSDPSNPSASYASLTENLSTLGKSEGGLSMLLKNDKLYINAGGIHASGLSVTSGWKVMPLQTYISDIGGTSSSTITPTAIRSAQSSLLAALVSSAKITANGSSTVNGQAVNVYTATVPYSKLIPAMAKAKGVLSSSLGAVLSSYRTTGDAKLTIETTKSTNRIADINGVFSSTFAPVKGSSTKDHFVISVSQQYSNYGVKFTVHAPASAKTVTNFKGI